MVENGPKTHFYGLLTPLCPILVASPLPFWGSLRPFWAQKGAPKGPKMVKKSKKKNRFLDSARNALKWHPNGLKRSQNTFLWPFDPLWPNFGRLPLSFGAPRAIVGPQKAQKGPKWLKMVKKGPTNGGKMAPVS